MSETLQIGDPPISIEVRRKKNARRLTLRLAAKGIFLTIPTRTPLSEAKSFAVKQDGWLRAKLDAMPDVQPVHKIDFITVRGTKRRIVAGTGRTCRLFGDDLHVPGPENKLTGKIRAFLKEAARDDLTAASDYYAGKLGRPYGKITIRDTRSRWGSCTTAGDLMYSWRLVMAPPRVLQYVAAHEVCHLIEMNHSDKFWHLVSEIMPDYAQPRRWLRQNGATLHAITFEA